MSTALASTASHHDHGPGLGLHLGQGVPFFMVRGRNYLHLFKCKMLYCFYHTTEIGMVEIVANKSLQRHGDCISRTSEFLSDDR